MAVCGGSGGNGRRLLCRDRDRCAWHIWIRYLPSSKPPAVAGRALCGSSDVPVLSQASISRPVGPDHSGWTAGAAKPGEEPCANPGVGHLVGWVRVCLGPGRQPLGAAELLEGAFWVGRGALSSDYSRAADVSSLGVSAYAG